MGRSTDEMRYSLFSVNDHYPDRERSLAELYRQVTDQAVEAESLGFDTFFCAEHHFHEYGAVPDPAVLLAGMAQKTESLRLGTAISVLTFHDPRTVAERYAMLDLVSGGRVVLGVGSGYLKHEFEGFGIDPAEKRDRFDEALTVVQRLLAGERVTHQGRFFNLEEVALNVHPQKPLPFYVAVLRKEAAWHVGRAGHHIMCVPYASLDHFNELEPLVQSFQEGCSEGGHDGNAIFTFHAHVAETDEQAREQAQDAFDLYVATRLYARQQVYDDILTSGLALFGSVETVAEKVITLHKMGLRHVSLLNNFGLMDPKHVSQSMRLFAQEVMPRVRQALTV